MQGRLSLILIMIAIPLTALFAAQQKVIYGVDSRVEVQDANPRYAQWARSTAGMISTAAVVAQGEYFKIRGITLEQTGVCAGERFSQQLTAASCSGFLVGKDLLVTAGHCVKDMNNCMKNLWVFGYNDSAVEEGAYSFTTSKKNVYFCKKIISRSQNMLTKNDYALIQLDRKVIGRAPLKLSKKRVKVGTELVIIGHPTGLPTKIADGATVRKKNWKHFKANLDSFGGNSGSAVINRKTGKVEGILVRGERDYRSHDTAACSVVYTCSDNGCRGEEVTYIKNVKKLR